MARISELLILVINAVILAFLAFNFNTMLVVGYSVMLISGYLIFKDDKHKTVYTELKPNRLKSVALAIGGLFVFFIISNVIISFLNSTGFIAGISRIVGLNSVIELFAETIPFFAQNKVITWIAFGFAIPIIETDFFFGNGMEFFKDIFRLKLDLKSPRTWGFFGLIAAAFILFHITAKAVGIGAVAALITVGIFAIIQLVVVMVEGQTLAAKLMHIFANTLALMVVFAVFPGVTWAFLIVGAIAVIFLILTKQVSVIGVKT